MYNNKTKWVNDIRYFIWLYWLFCQKQESQKVWWTGSLPDQVQESSNNENEFNKFSEDDSDVDVTMEAGNEMESTDIIELSPDSSNDSWCIIKTGSTWKYWPLVFLIYGIGNTAAEIN